MKSFDKLIGAVLILIVILVIIGVIAKIPQWQREEQFYRTCWAEYGSRVVEDTPANCRVVMGLTP